MTSSSMEPGNIEVAGLSNAVSSGPEMLWRRELPFLQETDGVLQGFVLLLQLLVAIVKDFESLSISAENEMQ